MKKLIISIVFVSLLFSCKNKPVKIYSEMGTKEINGTQLFYRVLGSGEPILIIHGGPGLSHDYLLPNLKNLSNKYKLIFYDQRASGSSSINLDVNSITIDNFIQDIDELRNVFGIEKLNIMAHSWGGILAMKYAIKHSENTKSLILINSVGASSKISVLTNQVLAERFTKKDSILRSEIFKSDEFKKRKPEAIESLMKIGFKHQFYDKTYIDSLNLSLNNNYIITSQLLQNLAKDLTEYDFHSDLKSIQCPTLLIYGNYDPLTELAGTRIHQSIVQSEFKKLDNCGHFPFIELEDEFKTIVVNFMETNKTVTK
jgi:proline iminopeptidase